MNDVTFPQCRDISEWWSRAITSWMWQQWRLLDAQYKTGIELLGAAAGEPAALSALESLEQYALARTRKGLAPPREVYNAQNRSRIDWSRFPEWAKPIDPELFEGSAHEG
jgi:hypothetical protein